MADESLANVKSIRRALGPVRLRRPARMQTVLGKSSVRVCAGGSIMWDNILFIDIEPPLSTTKEINKEHIKRHKQYATIVFRVKL